MVFHFIISNIEEIKKLGSTIARGVSDGIIKVAREIEGFIFRMSPEDSNKYVTIIQSESIDSDSPSTQATIGSTEFSPEPLKMGADLQKNKCTTHEFRFVNVRVEMGRNKEDVLRQAATDVVRSGTAKQLIVESIIEKLRSVFG